MKKMILLFGFLLAACAPILPTPNDFPSPPATIIVEFPNHTAAPTFVPRPQPILSADMEDAKTFFLVTKSAALAGDDREVAGRVLYPIDVNINGQSVTIRSTDEFIKSYKQIFDDKIFNALTETNEEDLAGMPDGIRVGNGELWFNLFCMDAACTQKDFLITQINN